MILSFDLSELHGALQICFLWHRWLESPFHPVASPRDVSPELRWKEWEQHGAMELAHIWETELSLREGYPKWLHKGGHPAQAAAQNSIWVWFTVKDLDLWFSVDLNSQQPFPGAQQLVDGLLYFQKRHQRKTWKMASLILYLIPDITEAILWSLLSGTWWGRVVLSLKTRPNEAHWTRATHCSGHILVHIYL